MITVAVVGLAVFVAVTVVTLAHLPGGASGGCGLSAPLQSLPAALRALGGFDQPYDATPAVLDRAALSAAGAVSPNLIGVVAQTPVTVGPSRAGLPAAVVVPLAGDTSASGTPGRLAGLVSFLRDCAGRAHLAAVDDLSGAGPSGPAAFPAVAESAAAARLSIPSPQLVYSESPFSPEWRDPANGATIPAS